MGSPLEQKNIQCDSRAVDYIFICLMAEKVLKVSSWQLRYNVAFNQQNFK